VYDWENRVYAEPPTCDCEEGSAREEGEYEVVARGTATTIVAPPGSFTPGAHAAVWAGGQRFGTTVMPNGSLYVDVVVEDFDLRGTDALVSVGSHTHVLPLIGGSGGAWLTPLGEDDVFPEGALAVEYPSDTIWIRGRLERAGRASPVAHAIVATYPPAPFTEYGAREWVDPPPYGEVFEAHVPGQELYGIRVVMMHELGTAASCTGERDGTPCGCAKPVQEAGQCRYLGANTPPSPPGEPTEPPM
jgi:hypothetical protein